MKRAGEVPRSATGHRPCAIDVTSGWSTPGYRIQPRARKSAHRPRDTTLHGGSRCIVPGAIPQAQSCDGETCLQRLAKVGFAQRLVTIDGVLGQVQRQRTCGPNNPATACVRVGGATDNGQSARCRIVARRKISSEARWPKLHRLFQPACCLPRRGLRRMRAPQPPCSASNSSKACGCASSPRENSATQDRDCRDGQAIERPSLRFRRA